MTRVRSMQPHHAKTLDMWAGELAANKDRAIALQSQEVYDRYINYVTGCANLFRDGYTTSTNSRSRTSSMQTHWQVRPTSVSLSLWCARSVGYFPASAVQTVD